MLDSGCDLSDVRGAAHVLILLSHSCLASVCGWTEINDAVLLVGRGLTKPQEWPFRAPEALLIGYDEAVVGHLVHYTWIVMFQTYSPAFHRLAASESPTRLHVS